MRRSRCGARVWSSLTEVSKGAGCIAGRLKPLIPSDYERGPSSPLFFGRAPTRADASGRQTIGRLQISNDGSWGDYPSGEVGALEPAPFRSVCPFHSVWFLRSSELAGSFKPEGQAQAARTRWDLGRL